VEGDVKGGPILFHGGVRDLRVGDRVVPSPPHVTDGCPLCVARAQGRTMLVGEYRAWLATMGPRAKPAIDALADAPDDAPVDPPTPPGRVYLTSDREYARWYAARSAGDMYRVEPVGRYERSPDDHFPTWTAASAIVREVVERRVRLDRKDRRALSRRWKRADARAM